MRPRRSVSHAIVASSIIFSAFGLIPQQIAYAQAPSSPETTPAQGTPDTPGQTGPGNSATPPARAPPSSAGQPKPPETTDKKGSNKTAKKPDSPAKEEKKEEHEPADPDTGTSTLSPATLGLLPNPYERRGIKFSLSYVADALASVSGGLNRAAVYDGRVNAAVDVDFAKLAALPGLTFHANVFEIHGPGLSRNYIGNLMPVSSIEALATVRLYEAWLEQKFWNDKFSIRAGQLAADAEFITSQYTDPFISATYGWPAITSIDLPSGGPSPPLAAMGARLKAIINDNFTLLAGVFDGNAAGPGTDDPQSRDRYGVNFRVNDPLFAIAEMQYAYNQEKNSAGLPGTIKLGGWYHAGPFSDQRFAPNGLSQADPAASPTPAQLNGDFGVYSVFEQMVATFTGQPGTRGIGIFARVSGSPQDRNLINFYADAGIVATGPSASRPNDKIGLAVAYSRISADARALDRDFEVLAGDGRPVRNYEANVTATYLVEIRKGWTVIPTLQYVINPGGGYVMDDGVARAVKNAAVIGARTVLKF